MRAKTAFFATSLCILSACMDTSNKPHPIQSALVGKRVTWDMNDALREKAAQGGEFAPVPETQTWRADGTTTKWWRPILRTWRTFPKQGKWRIEGRRTYCQSFSQTPDTDPESWQCYRLSLTDEGTRVHLEIADRDWFLDLRKNYHGTIEAHGS